MMGRLNELVRLIRTMVSERPGIRYKHEKCEYGLGLCSDNTLGCIFGQALTRMNWDILNPRDDRTISQVLEAIGYPPHDSMVRWCRAAQSQQDTGETWGDCVAYADQLMEETGNKV